MISKISMGNLRIIEDRVVCNLDRHFKEILTAINTEKGHKVDGSPPF